MKYAMVLLTLIGWGLSASAGEIANWNLNEGTATSFGQDGNDFYTDGSGTGNDLATWNAGTAPAGSADVPFAIVPQTGVANTGSLQFSGGQDLYTRGAKPLTTTLFNAGWTIEASFKATDTTAWGVIVGKDGDTGGPPPFSMKFRGDNQHLEVGFWNDDASAVWFFSSSIALAQDAWYSTAATYDGATAKLYIKGAGDSAYNLVGQLAAAGGNLHPFDSGWSVGRGQWNGGNTDNFKGFIDEVKISDVALDPSQFVAVPEPATLGLFALLGGGMLWLRKRLMI